MGNHDAIRMHPADFLCKPLAIWPADEREGKAYSFTLSHTDGRHLTIDEYVLIRAALGLTSLPHDEVLDIFARFPRAVAEDQEVL